MEFNLQTFLSEMRREQNENYKDLANRVDGVVTTVNNHETRLVIVENDRKTVRWLAATLIVAALGVVARVVFL